MSDIVEWLREKQQDMADAIKRYDSGEMDFGAMTQVRSEQFERYKQAADEIDKLRAAVEALAAIVQAERVAKYQEQVRYKVSRSDSAKAALAEYDAALALADAALGNGTERAA